MAAQVNHPVSGNAGPQGHPPQQASLGGPRVHQVPQQRPTNPVFHNDGIDGTYTLPQMNMAAHRQFDGLGGELYQTGPIWAPGQLMKRGSSDEGPRIRRQDSSVSISTGSAWTSPSHRVQRYHNDLARRTRREVFDTREDDQCLTETQARDRLSSYVVIRMEKADVDHDVDRDGNQRFPSWEKAEQVILTDVSEQDAHRKVRELDMFTPSITDKRRDLAKPINHQLDHALDKLEEQEIDSRYCYVLAQIDQKQKKMAISPESSQMYFVEHPHSKVKGRKDSKKKHGRKGRKYAMELHNSKPRRKKQTVSLIAYFRRTPKADENCLRMLQDADNSWDLEERDEAYPNRLRQPHGLFRNKARRSSSPNEAAPQRLEPFIHQELRQTVPLGHPVYGAQQPGLVQQQQQLLQHAQQQKQPHNFQTQLHGAGAPHLYQVRQQSGPQQPSSANQGGQAGLGDQNRHPFQQQQLQHQQRPRDAGHQPQQPAVKQQDVKSASTMQSGRGQMPPAPPANNYSGPSKEPAKQNHPQAKQQNVKTEHVKQDSETHRHGKGQPQQNGGHRVDGRKPPRKERGRSRVRSVSSLDSEPSDSGSVSDSDSESSDTGSSVDSRRHRSKGKGHAHGGKHCRSRSRPEHYGRRRHSKADARRNRPSRSISTSSSDLSRSPSPPVRNHATSSGRRRDGKPAVSPIRFEAKPPQPKRPNVRHVDPNPRRSTHEAGFENVDEQFRRMDIHGNSPQSRIRFGGRGGSGNGPRESGRGAESQHSGVPPSHPFAPRHFVQQQGKGY